MRTGLALFCLLLSLALFSNAQTVDSTTKRLQQLPPGYLNKVSEQAHSIDQSLQKKTDKYLNKLSRLEAKLWRKLAGKDTTVKTPYPQLTAQMENPVPSAPATVCLREVENGICYTELILR
jgi:Skp family chaperone for outer membrane proteins